MPAELATLVRWRATGLPTTTPGAAAPDASDEVARLGAVQAQEFEMTLWSLGRRTGENRASVLARFEAGEFVRTHALRQTWHFVHRDDLTLVQAATAHRVHKANAPMYQQEGLDEATRRRASEVIAEAVAAGPRTRAEIAERLAANGVETTGFRLGLIMMWAELECLVVNGPMSGKRHTYARWPDQVLPDRDEATAVLAERFFSSHGPATVADFAAWASLTKSAAKDAVEALPVERAEVEGVEHLWFGELTDAEWASPQVELLNCYDEYISGLRPQGKRSLDRAGLWVQRLGIPNGVLMIDGQLTGNWRRTTSARQVLIDVVRLRELSDAERVALDRHAAAYGEFLGLEPSVTVSAL